MKEINNTSKNWAIKLSKLSLSCFLLSLTNLTVAETSHVVQNKASSLKVSEKSYKMPSLSLVRNNGTKTPLAEIFKNDKSLFVNFIFTSCNTICPAMTGTFARLDKKINKTDKEMNLISISIDPEFDTPRELQRYAKVLRASDKWQFYTGNREDIVKLQTAFNAYRGSKMNHVPITLIKNKGSEKWIRIDGFASADELMNNTQ